LAYCANFLLNLALKLIKHKRQILSYWTDIYTYVEHYYCHFWLWKPTFRRVIVLPSTLFAAVDQTDLCPMDKYYENLRSQFRCRLVILMQFHINDILLCFCRYSLYTLKNDVIGLFIWQDDKCFDQPYLGIP
jgi:hypothetical protein